MVPCLIAEELFGIKLDVELLIPAVPAILINAEAVDEV